MAQEGDVGQGMIRPEASEGADDDDRMGPGGDRREERQLGVRGILGNGPEVDLDASPAQLGEGLRAEGIAVADPAVELEAQGIRVPGSPVSGDDEIDAVIPAGPRIVESGSRWSVAGGEDHGPSRAGHRGIAARKAPTQLVTEAATSVAPAASSSPRSPRIDSIPTPRAPTALAIRMSSGASPT